MGSMSEKPVLIAASKRVRATSPAWGRRYLMRIFMAMKFGFLYDTRWLNADFWMYGVFSISIVFWLSAAIVF
jgi:hypothetical protein